MKHRKNRSGELQKRVRHKTKTKQSRLRNLKRGIEAGSAPPTTPPRNGMESVGVRNDFMSMRIQDLQRMERLISKHRRECDLDANLEISNFSIRTRTVTFLCSCCKEELPFETSKVVTFRGYTVREHALRQTLKSKMAGLGYSQAERNSIAKFVSHDHYDSIVERIIYTVAKELWNEHVERSIAAFRHKRVGDDKEKIVTCMIELDGRFNKVRGWNSLDGHLLGVLYDFVDGKTVKIPIFLRPMHRPPPFKRRESNFSGAPQNLDKTGAVEFLETLVTKYRLNPTIILHDDDSEAMKHMRKANQELVKKGYDLVTCACDGNECNKIVTKINKKGKKTEKVERRGKRGRKASGSKVGIQVKITWQYCCDGDICKGIREVLCVRHGTGHFGQELIVLGKQIYLKHGEKYKIGRALKFLAGSQGPKYFKAAIGGLFRTFTTVETLKNALHGFGEHCKGDHDNDYCKKHYKKCQAVDWTPTFVAETPAEIEIVETVTGKWSRKDVLCLYKDNLTTNFCEAANSVFLMFFSKRQFAVNPHVYDCQMYIHALYLQYGPEVERMLWEKVGVPLDETTSAFISNKIKQRAGNKRRRESPEAKERRPVVLKGRKMQYKSYKDATYKKRKVKHLKEKKGPGICKSSGCLEPCPEESDYCPICDSLFCRSV